MNTRFNPVVFDLDGTILDSAPAIVAALEEACSRAGVGVPEGVDLSTCVGPPLETALPEVVGSNVDISRLIALYREIYRPLAEEETVPMPGAVELLNELSRNGVTLAIATYKPRDLAVSLLRSTGIAHLFDVCGGRLPDDTRSKTEILDEVLRDLAPHRGRPLYIGDHEEDRIAAEGVTVRFVSYGRGMSWSDISRRVFGISERDDDRADNDAAAG